MAASKVPLNKFRNVFVKDTLVTESSTLVPCYSARTERAAIVIQAQATNPTDSEHIVFLRVKTFIRGTGYVEYSVAENVLLPPYDSKALVIGRLVLQGVDGGDVDNPDILMYGATDPRITLALGILETKNTD
jgi:hypothetical protein